MSPALYPILFEQIKIIVEKFFDTSGQVRALESVTSLSLHNIYFWGVGWVGDKSFISL
jgi:neurofibromin 1